MPGENRGQAAGEEFDEATCSVMPQHRVVRLQLLRHGAVRELERRGVRGQLDTPLSEEGRLQTRRLVDWMVEHEARPDRLVGSDLTRCRELGEALAERWALPYEPDLRLREQDMGHWQGLSWGEISERYGPLVNDYWNDYVHTCPPGGEPLAAVARRVEAWWTESSRGDEDLRLCVVTHVGVIRSLVCARLGLPLDQALRLTPATGSHTSLLVSDAGAVLAAFGERPWMFGEEP